MTLPIDPNEREIHTKPPFPIMADLWLVKIIGIGAACILILIMGIALFLNIIDPNDYKSSIEQRASEHLNGALFIDRMSWSLWPGIGLTLHEGSVVNRAKEEVLRWEEGRINVKLGPLLSGKVRIDDIILKSSNITLNFQDGKNPTDIWKALHKPPKQGAHQEEAEKERQNLLSKINLDSIQIRQATVQVMTNTKEFALNNFNMELHDLKPRSMATLEISSDYMEVADEADPPVVKSVEAQEQSAGKSDTAAKEGSEEQSEAKPTGPTVINGNGTLTASFELKRQKLEIEAIEMRSTTLNFGLGPLNVVVTAEGEYNFKTDVLELPVVQTVANFAKLNGAFTAEDLRSSPEIIFTMEEQKISPGFLLKSFIQRSPGISHAIELADSLRIGGSFIYTEEQVGLLLDPLKIDTHDGRVDIAYTFDSHRIDSTIFLSYIDLRPIIDPPETAIFADRKRVKLAEDTLSFDDVPLPKEFLNDLDFDLTFTVSNMIFPEIEMKELRTRLRANKGILNLKPIEFYAFGGEVRGEARLDATQTPSELTLLQSSDRIDIDEAFLRSTDVNWLLGTLDNKTVLSTEGETINEFLNNARGTLDIKMTKGSIPEANLEGIAYKAVSAMKGTLTPSARASFERTDEVMAKESNIKDFFANLIITPKGLHTNTAILRLNERPVSMNIDWLRDKNLVAFTTNIALTTEDPVLENLVWPVTCRIEDWALPKCGVDIREMQKRVRDLKSANNKGRSQKLMQQLDELNVEDEAKAKLRKKLLQLKR